MAYKVLLWFHLIRNVFHVSLLKKYKGELLGQELSSIPKLLVGNNPVVLLIEVLGHRTLLGKGKLIDEMLVRYLGLHNDETFWEEMFKLKVLYFLHSTLRTRSFWRGREMIETTPMRSTLWRTHTAWIKS